MAATEGSARRDGRTTDTRERIQQAAIELFMRQGFANTSLQDIAGRLGLTKAALYYHFPSKAELIASVLRPAIDDVNAFLDDAERAELSPREVLERFFDLNYEHRAVFAALILDPAGLAAVDAVGWVARLATGFQRLLAGPDATPEQRIRAIMAANGLSRCATLLTDVPYDELRATTVDVAVEIVEG